MTAATIRKPGQSKPFPVRLTEAERNELERRSGSMPVGTYVKQVLFSDDGAPRRGARAPVKDHAALASMLAQLGASRTAEWLAMLAHAAESGTLAVDEETTTKLNRACHDVLVIRLLLMRALGIQMNDDAGHDADDGADAGAGDDLGADDRRDHDLGVVLR